MRLPVSVWILSLSISALPAWAWSWSEADRQAPADTLFTRRGAATVEMGPSFAAPGAPPEFMHLYGVVRYRDYLEPHRDYDLYFSPGLAIWRFVRWEPGHAASSQYVGGFHYANCQDGFVTATDRVLMPAIGATNATECGLPTTSVRTNYGCMNNHFSLPFPLDNYQGAGSGSGEQPEIVEGPTWDTSDQSLFSVSLSKPWISYEGILDPASPQFTHDFIYCPDKSLIEQQVRSALRNVRLENQIRVLPDGTIMLTHTWRDLKGRAWITSATDGYWMAPDSAPAGRVFYYDSQAGRYVEPFAGGQNPQGLYLTTGNGWVGYFIDTIRPEFGMGFFYYVPAGIGIFAADNWPYAPAVLHTDFFTSIVPFGGAFRQMFVCVGTKEEMQTKTNLLQPYVRVSALPPAKVETYCHDGIDDDRDGLTDDGDPDCLATCRCPDSDGDGDVDQSDFGRLQACLTNGFGAAIESGCGWADFDTNGKIDAADVAALVNCYSGPGIPAASGCTP